MKTEGRLRIVIRVASVFAAIGTIWGVGLVWYAADMRAIVSEIDTRTDAIVVLTGGSVRVKTGVALLRAGQGARLFISGVHAGVNLAELIHSINETPDDLSERIVLGYAADDTSSNAAETAGWMHTNGYVSLRLVTAAYHMRRSVLEFQRAMPGFRIVPHPVFPLAFKQEEWWRWPGTATLIATEYTKYLVAVACHWVADHRLRGGICVIVIRSALFNTLFLLWTIGLGLVVVIPGLVGPRQWAQRSARLWSRGIFLLLEHVLSLYYEVRGLENIPSGPVIIAAKHQSTWDTLFFHTFLEDPVFIVKRELFAIPVVGWLMRKSGCIGIDRSKNMRALWTIKRGAENAARNGSQLVVFPEGTRTAPGVGRSYQVGVAMLYHALSLPVVPVALNSGLFWGRRSFVKRPGRIVVEFLPPMPTGMERHAFVAELQFRIESSSHRLLSA